MWVKLGVKSFMLWILHWRYECQFRYLCLRVVDHDRGFISWNQSVNLRIPPVVLIVNWYFQHIILSDIFSHVFMYMYQAPLATSALLLLSFCFEGHRLSKTFVVDKKDEVFVAFGYFYKTNKHGSSTMSHEHWTCLDYVTSCTSCVLPLRATVRWGATGRENTTSCCFARLNKLLAALIISCS